MHQDKDEKSMAPVVSLSIGDTCVFRFGNIVDRGKPYTDIELMSGGHRGGMQDVGGLDRFVQAGGGESIDALGPPAFRRSVRRPQRGLQHLSVRPPSEEPVLDLHGLRVADALRRATSFLVAEQQRGTVAVLIVTGHGTGAVKAAIRTMLASHPAVARVQQSLRGDAAVLVVLKPPVRKRG
jgi:hypothetical protein